MRNRHERRKAAATYRKKLARLSTLTLDRHFDDVLRRARAEFEETGEICPRFECVADGESFQISTIWSDHNDRDAACFALRECFRRRGVKRYVFVNEGWVGKTPGLSPTDDPARGECVQVIAVERDGPRRWAFAEILRNGETATLEPWAMTDEASQSWLLELLEDGHSDRSPKAEPPPLGRMSMQDLLDHGPGVAEFRESVEELRNLMADQVQKDANGDPHAMYLALESVVRSIVKDQGSPRGIGEFARILRDHPDRFPMFSTAPMPVPSGGHLLRRCKATLQHFIREKREAGRSDSAIFGAFMNMYMRVGSQAIGALSLANRIENWDPAHQAKLRQVGLRSSYELDDEEGHVFFALSAKHYPVGVMGRRNAVGDLFVSRVVVFRQGDFATVVEGIKRTGTEVILESEAEELLSKMQQVEGFALQADKGKEI
jgi:hypothetical protein